jgi:hypothetical protein
MRLANFLVPGAGGQTGQVSVVTLPTAVGQQVQVLNIFRERLRVPPLTDADLPSLVRQVPFGTGPGQMFDMPGEESADPAQRARLLVAIFTNNAAAWYFNFYGQSNLLEREMLGFLAFLKSVQVETGMASAPVAAATPAPASASPGGALQRPSWTVPNGWQETPPGQMQIGRFTVSGDAGKLEITIAAFPGDVGGVAANVNRWRRQIALEPVADDAAVKSLTPLDVPGGTAMLADMSNQRDGRRMRLIGVIWSRGDHTWFYKLTGDDALAERERAAFLEFVQSVRHRDA